MATAQVSQGDVDVVVRALAAGAQASQYDVTVIFNFPSQRVDVSQCDVDLLTEDISVPIEVSEYDVDVVIRGKVYNPKLRAWTFDLDGHEFYVLRLGDMKSLVYDLTTEQWSWWSSPTLDYWRASIGTNWTSSGNIPFDYGSNVVVGDDNFGILWILNPEQGVDDSVRAEEREEGIIKPFPRVATGQVTTRGRITIPCYQVYLTADPGEPAYVGASVSLSYSDDGGKTFISASEPITVQAGNYYQEFAWRSIGLVRSPGRLFRITDDGAFPQINELTIYDNSTS
jgi:hypothetical protein